MSSKESLPTEVKRLLPGAFGASRLTFIEAIFLYFGGRDDFWAFFYLTLPNLCLSSINSCLWVFGQLFVFDFGVSKLVEGCLSGCLCLVCFTRC